MALYSRPSASVLVNDSLSTPFRISNGTHQECSPSPLLFVLVTEHLARDIRQNDSIKGIQTPSADHKLSLYAEDLLMYIQQPHTSLPSLMHEFHRFGEYRITIPFNLSNLYTLNYLPLLTQLRKELDTWNLMPLPWFGRINTIKMDTLPKLLYVFQTVPISVPKHFFRSLRSMTICFI